MTIPATALALHLEAAHPHPAMQRPTPQTEQFVDSPPPEKYHYRWRRDCADNPDALYVMNPTAVEVTNQIRGNFNCDNQRTEHEAK